MPISAGDTVMLVRQRRRAPESSSDPAHCQIWETVELSSSDRKVGLVIRDGNNYAKQLTVLCGGKERYWFEKNVIKIWDVQND
jgi:hypothetical protein